MRNPFTNRWVIVGGIVGGLILGWFMHIAPDMGLPFGWQLVVCMAFGAIAGLVIGFVYRLWDGRARRQNQ